MPVTTVARSGFMTFSAWSGEAGPPGAKIAVYPVKIEGEDVLIEI